MQLSAPFATNLSMDGVWMKIELYYFDGCESWKTALSNLQVVLREEKLDSSVDLFEVKSDEEAAELKFPGSPTFRMDGEDFWPESRDSYWMSCRLYRTPDGLRGAPTVEMFRKKLIQMRES